MVGMADIIGDIKHGVYQAHHLCDKALLSHFQFIDKTVRSPSGLSCLDHAYCMVRILDVLDVDQDTIDAALLYVMVEYGDLVGDDLTDAQVLKLVQGIQTMSAINQVYSVSGVDDNIAATDAMRRMMLAMVRDGRTVLIKLVEQVVILLNSKHMSKDLQAKIAKETMMIYGPLANRLGLSALKWQLEDLAFKIQNPEVYKSLSQGLSANRKFREDLVVKIVTEIKSLFKAQTIEFDTCYGRAKHLFSLYKKMHRKNLTLQEIYDAIAIRVIFHDVDACYQALSVIHDQWSVVQKEFDDYIAKPKANGYQSIHTAILYQNSPVEIQLRTKDMHAKAEIGVAAHWLYKEGTKDDIKNKSRWLTQLTAISPNYVDLETVNSFEQHAIKLFQDRVFVFTHTGEVRDLIKGATALDFAYAIHSQVGHRCKGVKINGAIAPIKTILTNGDKVEVLVNKNGKPSHDWLNVEYKYLATPKARAKVAHWFRVRDQETRELGKNKLMKFCKVNSLDVSDSLSIIVKKYTLTAESVYYKIGTNELNLTSLFRAQTEKPQSIDIEKVKIKQKSGVLVDDCTGVQTTLAACCFPLPGDAVMGLITSNRGVVVHRAACVNIVKANPDRVMSVTWESTNNIYPAQLFCSCTNYDLAVSALQRVLAVEKIALTYLNVNNYGKEQVLFEFRVMLKDSAILHKIIANLLPKKFIINVWR